MHETGVIQALMRQIQEVAEAQGATRVRGVSVWLGALSQMSPKHFAEHFEEASAGTLAEGARLTATASDDLDHPHAQSVVLESVEVEA